MAYTIDTEDIVFELIDVLGDNMFAKLKAITDAKTTYPIALENIKRYYFGDKAGVPSLNSLPAVIVKAREYVPNQISIASRYRDNINLEIEIYIGSNTNRALTIDGRTFEFEEIMDIKILRYSKAIVEILLENQQLNSKSIIENITNVSLSNIIDFDGMLLKACRLNVEIIGATNTIS